MGLLDKIKEGLSQRTEKVSEVTEKIVEKGKKKHSSNYVIEKFSEDLSSANAIIDHVIISGKSDVVNKLIKDIVLPKEALVSAIKRGEEVIIPDGNTQLKTDDEVIVIGKKNDVEKIVKRFAAN
jgi:Trk K+ transport system NAD-binding subunit